jgi:predicted polyphosphate/ATP-dependent NAD kinase
LIANPVSGHDIRRLVAGASVVTTTEKVNIVRRLVAGLGAVGVGHVVSMADNAGLAVEIARVAALEALANPSKWPTFEILDMPITQTVDDSLTATTAMLDRDVDAIVVLGGDGTARAVASVWTHKPMMALSTGTNNAFGVACDATVAGIAVGLVVSGAVSGGCYRAKQLVIEHRGQHEIALVDVAVISAIGLGTGAVWDPLSVREVFVTFAESHGIGLSTIAAAAAGPVDRRQHHGCHVRLDPSTAQSVTVAFAPGLVESVGVGLVELIQPGVPHRVEASEGVIAIDGERLLVFTEHDDPPTITLDLDGPLVIDVHEVMARRQPING